MQVTCRGQWGTAILLSNNQGILLTNSHVVVSASEIFAVSLIALTLLSRAKGTKSSCVGETKNFMGKFYIKHRIIHRATWQF